MDLVPSLIPHADRVVLVQNGFIDPLVAELEPGVRATRGLLWFTAKGERFEVLGPSLFHGPHASEVARILSAAGVASSGIADPAAFNREVIIKLAWNNVVGLPLAVHGVDLATYLHDFEPEARAVVTETCVVVGAELGVVVAPEEAYARILGTTQKLGWMRGGKKAVSFRNGAVARLGDAHRIPTPVNARLASFPAGPA